MMYPPAELLFKEKKEKHVSLPQLKSNGGSKIRSNLRIRSKEKKEAEKSYIKLPNKNKSP